LRPRTGKAAAHTRVGDRWQAVVPPWDSGPVESVERGDRLTFALEEAGRWRRAGDEWTRRGANPIRVLVAPSLIEGAGQGLFATVAMEEGTRLGRMHGMVVFKGIEDACEDWAIARGERYCVLLPFAGAHAIVDVRGTAFAMMNHSDEPNVHVRGDGAVEVCADVAAGDELYWDYGRLYGGVY